MCEDHLMRVLLVLVALPLALTACSLLDSGSGATVAPDSTAVLEQSTSSQTPATTATTTTTTTTTSVPPPAFGVVDGLIMFRGNPTRTFHGTGPVPTQPEVLWRFPDEPMCGTSSVGGEPKLWCGSGWTGQPLVWERPDGITEVIFGAYDKRVHFLDASTGERTRPDFKVDDIIKGTVALDPDGYPLLYVGSRVDRYMVVALDREVPTEIWSLPSDYVNGRWNDDWDSSAAVIDGTLLVGGENSWWFAVELNRTYDDAGLVQVAPDVVATIPAWSEQTLAAVGNQQSIENSTAVFDGVAYFANSAGRVVGVDLASISAGDPEIVLDFWAGDDIDATIVIDEAGMLYVTPQVDLRTSRAAEIGQLIKLDPKQPDDPLVWSIEVPGRGVDGGAWATPALYAGVLYLPTNGGELLAVDTSTGEVVWRDEIGFHAWSSPVVVDATLTLAVGCGDFPALRSYDLASPQAPVQLWEMPLAEGCIESTPAMWRGRIYVGSRDGYFYAVGDR